MVTWFKTKREDTEIAKASKLQLKDSVLFLAIYIFTQPDDRNVFPLRLSSISTPFSLWQ